jgi:hypothetical protein
VSTLRQYLDALGTRLELVAVFDDDDRRVPIHLGLNSTARPTVGVVCTSRRWWVRSRGRCQRLVNANRTNTRQRVPPNTDHDERIRAMSRTRAAER